MTVPCRNAPTAPCAPACRLARRLGSLAALAFALWAGQALAQGGIPPAPAEAAPAAPTAGSGPDGGKRYEYPPDTGAILRPENRTPYSGRGDPAPARPADANPIPGLSGKPPEQVGR